MNREGFFIRLGAAAIDFVICLVPALILTFVAAAAVGQYFAGVLATFIFVGYSSLEIFKSSTPGKNILKIKIQSEDGSDAARAALIKRWAIKQSPFLLSFIAALTTLNFINYFAWFAGIAYVISALLTFKAERQALHDTLCKTAVFKTQASAAPAVAATPEPQKQAA